MKEKVGRVRQEKREKLGMSTQKLEMDTHVGCGQERLDVDKKGWTLKIKVGFK